MGRRGNCSLLLILTDNLNVSIEDCWQCRFCCAPTVDPKSPRLFANKQCNITIIQIHIMHICSVCLLIYIYIYVHHMWKTKAMQHTSLDKRSCLSAVAVSWIRLVTHLVRSQEKGQSRSDTNTKFTLFHGLGGWWNWWNTKVVLIYRI